MSRSRLSVFALSFFAFAGLSLSPSILAQDEKIDTSFIEGRDYIIVNKTTPSNNSELIFANPNNTTRTTYTYTETPINYTSTRIYDSIVNGFKLPEQLSKEAQKRIQAQYNWYARNPKYMERVWTRAEPYIYFVKSELNKRGMPLELALLPIVESAFDPFAYSHGRASGMWQFIPGTAKMHKVKQNWWYDGRRDVLDSTRAALDYLESLHRQFDGNWLHAIAAYNSGPGNVRKGIRRNKKKDRPTDFWSLKLPRETEAYVPKLIAL